MLCINLTHNLYVLKANLDRDAFDRRYAFNNSVHEYIQQSKKKRHERGMQIRCAIKLVLAMISKCRSSKHNVTLSLAGMKDRFGNDDAIEILKQDIKRFLIHNDTNNYSIIEDEGCVLMTLNDTYLIENSNLIERMEVESSYLLCELPSSFDQHCRLSLFLTNEEDTLNQIIHNSENDPERASYIHDVPGIGVGATLVSESDGIICSSSGYDSSNTSKMSIDNNASGDGMINDEAYNDNGKHRQQMKECNKRKRGKKKRVIESDSEDDFKLGTESEDESFAVDLESEMELDFEEKKVEAPKKKKGGKQSAVTKKPASKKKKKGGKKGGKKGPKPVVVVENFGSNQDNSSMLEFVRSQSNGKTKNYVC